MLIRRFLVSVVALVAAVAGTPGMAGAAAKATATLGLHDAVVPLGSGSERVEIFVGVPEGSPQPGPGGDVRLTLNLADMAGVATASPVGGEWICQSSGTTLDCVWAGLHLGGLLLDLAPAPQARAGDSGKVPVRLTIRGLSPASGTMTVTVAEPVDLADASPRLVASGVPGDDITWPVRVRNADHVTADGVVAFFRRPYRVRFHERHGNCEYAVGRYGRAEYAACRFDAAKLPPGATYEVSPVPPMRIAADATGGGATPSVRWYTVFDWANDRARWVNDHTIDGFTPGTGPPLRLVEATTARAASQTDPDIENNSGSMYLTVNAETKADQAAVPATITGRVGESITLRLGNHNYGPTSVDWSDPQDEPAVFLQVTVPPGVTVTKATFCRSTRPDSAEYVCGDGSVHPAGETIWWEMTFRIDRKVPGAQGRLAISGFPDLPGPTAWDPNPANDTAPLKVRVLGDDSGGGGAGGLPVTGGDTRLIAMVGAALLILGAMAVAGPRYWRRIITPRASRVRD